MNSPNEHTHLLTHQAPPKSTSDVKEQQEHPSTKETLIRFLLLPSQIYTVLLLEFLNTFRSYGLRIVIFNYITNEYSISDAQAGRLLGIKSLIDIFVGLVGCIAVDFVGVRKISLAALSIASVARALMAFGRSKRILYAALFVCSPLGDALLSIGLYRVALKKLTTSRTRPLGFAVSYGAQNFAGVCVALLVDWIRAGDDVRVDLKIDLFDGIYTPVRQFVVLTWLVVLITFGIAFVFLEDLTVIDAYDSGTDLQVEFENGKMNHKEITQDRMNDNVTEPNGQCSLIQSAKPMFDPTNLQKWLPQTEQLAIKCNYQIFRTMHTKASITKSSPIQRISNFIHQLLAVLQLRNSWRVIVFSFSSVLLSLQWTASDISLPPFLERRFGEDVPIYTIQNIHMMGCMILPPVVGALMSDVDDFDVILPGMWIMAISPLLLVLSPTVIGACTWQIILTIGQCLWSPRQDSWVARLAPTGMEGLFFAVSCSRALFVPLGDYAMGLLNEKYIPNCPDCRDSLGHFCTSPIIDGERISCVSVQESCGMHLDHNYQTCPSTCNECPTWKDSDPSGLWLILMIVSIISPLLVWLLLPFVRGDGSFRNRST